MNDRPPSGDPSMSTSPPPNPAQRTFFSSTSAGEFFDQLRAVLDGHHTETLRAQEALFTQFSAPITALTTSIERLIGTMPVPQRPSESPPPNHGRREPPPVPERPRSEGPPVSPYRSPYRSPQPPSGPPVRGTTAFTSATAETAASALGGSTSGIKLPSFHGKDGENVIAWLHQAERFFRLKNTAEDRKVDLVSFALEDDAQSFLHYCFIRNNEIELTWEEFKHTFRQKYEVPRMRATLLRDKLDALRYRGPQYMPDFCEKFRQIESQIYDMAFTDRLNYFLKKLHPPEAAMHIQNQESLRSEDMEVVYQLARQWAINSRLLRHQEHNHRRSGKPLLKFGKRTSGESSSKSATTTAAKDSDDELDIIQPEELNKMDLLAVECFNCGKRGHFAHDCKSPPQTNKRVNFNKDNHRSKYCDKGHRTLYRTVEEEFSDNDNDQSDYSVLNPSGSESEEEALDLLNLMPTQAPDSPNDGDAYDVLNLMATYAYNHNKTSVTRNDGLISTKLPVYDVVLNKEHAGKSVVDSGASTLYLNEKTAQNMGLKITKIKPRKVKVADKDTIMIDSYCSFEAKIGDLPKETITAYTFPLGSIDLILGLPWLQKHNPHTDWKKLAFEFNRNGRRYMLWPAKPTPDIRIASPEEFASFIDGNTSFFLIAPPKSRTPQSLEKLLQLSEDSQVSKHSKHSEDGKKSTSVQPATDEPKVP